MPEILELIKVKDRLSFSQNFSVKRAYKGNTLFPDVKTRNLEAEYSGKVSHQRENQSV